MGLPYESPLHEWTKEQLLQRIGEIHLEVDRDGPWKARRWRRAMMRDELRYLTELHHRGEQLGLKLD